jgi:hypothetical protein
MDVGGQRHVPAALTPEKSRYPLYRKLGWSQGRSGRVRKNSPPPGFDLRTVQPVACRYTDLAIEALCLGMGEKGNAYRILAGKCDGMRRLGGPTSRSE